jgi:hypothetical protein
MKGTLSEKETTLDEMIEGVKKDPEKVRLTYPLISDPAL